MVQLSEGFMTPHMCDQSCSSMGRPGDHEGISFLLLNLMLPPKFATRSSPLLRCQVLLSGGGT